jgi:hypothetical protein
LLFTLWGFLIIELNKKISIDNDLRRVVLIFILAIMHNTIRGLIFVYLGNFIPVGIFFRTVSLGSIYTAAVLPLLFKVITPISKFTFNRPMKDE